MSLLMIACSGARLEELLASTDLPSSAALHMDSASNSIYNIDRRT